MAQDSNNRISEIVQFPGRGVDLARSGEGEASVSERAVELAGDPDRLARAVEELGSGESVLVVDGRCLLVSKTEVEDGFAATVREAGRDGLRRHLDYRYGNECVLLVDGSYLILGASSAVEKVFGRLDEEARISAVLDSASMMSFQGAFEDEVRGAETYPFTVRTTDASGGLMAQVVRLHRLAGADTLVRVHLYQPSVDLADFSPADASFLDTIMRNVPMAAIRVNREGLVTRANDQAVRLALETSARDPESTYFFDWVHPEERNKVISLHKRRASGHYAPFKYRVRLQPASDITLQTEVTALQLPDETETLVFLNLLDLAEGHRNTTASHMQHIAGMAGNLAESDDVTSGLLDLMREAVSADGAAILSTGMTLTSGSAPVTSSMNGSGLASEMRWEEASHGLYNLVLPLKHPEGLVNVRFYGLHSNQPDPLARLFMGLAPVLTDMIVTRMTRRSVSSAMSGVLSFFGAMAEDSDDLDGLMERLADVCGADRALLSIVAGPEAVLSPVGGFGFPGALPSLTLHGDFTSGWAYTHQEVVYVPNMALDERFSSSSPGTASELAIPMNLRGRTIGALLVSSTKPSAFPNPLPSLLQVLATALALRVAMEPAGGAGAETRSGQRGRTDRVEMEATLDEMSRRIRSSLSTMDGYLDLMSRESLGPLEKEQSEAVEAMTRAMGGLRDYAGNLLTFLRLDLGPVDVDPAWSHPSDLLSPLEPRLMEKAARYGVELDLELPEEPFTAFFDKARMEHIVLSLVDNAVRFNKPGGSASISVSREGESWTLEVSDTGRGIPAGSLPYIYDRFYSEDPDGAGRSGLGIGLAVVKRFTEAMNGTISVWSREGRGTRVQVRLPVSG